jgi:hypothetical protein
VHLDVQIALKDLLRDCRLLRTRLGLADGLRTVRSLASGLPYGPTLIRIDFIRFRVQRLFSYSFLSSLALDSCI